MISAWRAGLPGAPLSGAFLGEDGEVGGVFGARFLRCAGSFAAPAFLEAVFQFTELIVELNFVGPCFHGRKLTERV